MRTARRPRGILKMLESESKMVRVIRRVLPFTTAGCIVAILYVGWVFMARWSENRSLEQAAEAQKQKPDNEVTRTYGSDKLKIVSFYTTPGAIARGEKALICYGVANAKTVRLDPPVERVWPSVSRCLEVSPSRDTKYTLTAEDAQGHRETASFLLRVK